MIRTIKKRAMSLLLVLTVLISVFAGMEFISVSASACDSIYNCGGLSAWSILPGQIDAAIYWATRLADDNASGWKNIDGQWEVSKDYCTNFVRDAFRVGAGMEYQPWQTATHYLSLYRVNNHKIYYGDPPRGAIALYRNADYDGVGHMAISLGNGSIVEGGYWNVQYGTLHHDTSLVYVGYMWYGDMLPPVSEPMTTPMQTYNNPDKTYFVGDTIELSWVASSPNSALHRYWVGVYYDEALTQQKESLETHNTSFSTVINEPATYYFVVEAIDSSENRLRTVEKVVINSAHTHDWSEWKFYPMSEAAPACWMRTCKTCGEIQAEDIICDGVHHALEKREAIEATCTQTGRIEFWACSLCNSIFADANGTTEINDITAPQKAHDWGEWTSYPMSEAAPAYRTRTCKICSEVQSEDIICDGVHHTLEKREAIEATCTQTGRIEFWVCSLCNRIFADANGTMEINDITAPKKAHDWGEWMSYPMSEAAPAYRTRTCKICGEVQSEDIICDGVHHTLEKREAIEATCTQTGRIEFWACSLCNSIFADANGTTEINDITAPKKEHSWNNGIVTTPATTAAAGVKTYTCTVCGETKTESIAKLPSGGLGSSSGGGATGGGGSHRPSTTPSSTTAETVTVNGVSKSWAEAVTTINSVTNESTVTISGSIDTPADVIAAAARKDVKLEVRASDTFTWVIDAAKVGEGSKYLSVSDSVITATNKMIRNVESSKDFRITETKLGTGASLRYSAGRTNSDKFANLFRVDGSDLVFVKAVKIDKAGDALFPITTAGTYKVVTSGETKLVGDLDNSTSLNALDAALMLKKLVMNEVTADEAAKFDFNGDGRTNALDAAALLSHIVN